MPVTERLTDARERYSPGLRTALVLAGTGTHGAYHAGALRGLSEAGVKIDLVAGRGIGAAAAVFAALDGAPRLWEANGIWRARGLERCYRWRPALRGAGWLGALLLLVLLSPLAFLALGLLVYPTAFLLQLFGLDVGRTLVGLYAGFLTTVFQPAMLPTIVPRLGMIVLAALFLVLLVSATAAWFRAPARRRQRGHLLWRLFGAPLTSGDVQQRFLTALSNLIRGAAPAGSDGLVGLARRVSEVLVESLGQPGFRDVLFTVHDVDAGRDLVFALLREPYRREFFARTERRAAEAFDLAGVARDYACDGIAGALAVPAASEPHLVRFTPDSYWQGEAHRLTDRAGALARLLDEVARAGAEQVIVVSGASQASEPHQLRAPRVDARGRLGEVMASDERASLHDAVAGLHERFRALFVIQPVYNPIGPFDFSGSYDERSDRHHRLDELLAIGYRDAYQQFIEPVVGSSGDRLAAERAEPAAPRWEQP